MNPQQQISENIKARGYYKGHDDFALLARHVVKLQEELCELSMSVRIGPDDLDYDAHTSIGEFETLMDDMQIASKEVFDRADFSGSDYSSLENVKKELADCLVVIMSMAEVINQHSGPFDVIQAALEKSSGDIKRGVR